MIVRKEVHVINLCKSLLWFFVSVYSIFSVGYFLEDNVEFSIGDELYCYFSIFIWAASISFCHLRLLDAIHDFRLSRRRRLKRLIYEVISLREGGSND